jgi:cytochrome c oxidase cbb3-type subunit 4
MDTYSLLREFADSWALLALFGIFVFVILWSWRPGSRALHDDAADVPFRHDDRPAPLPRGQHDSTAKVRS